MKAGLRIIPFTAFALLLAFAPVSVFAVSDSTASSEEAVRQQTTVPENATSPTDPAGPAFVTPEAGDPVHAAETHGEGGLPQLNIGTYPSQIFWLMVMFTVLYLAFSKSVLPSIGAVVEGRDNMIKGNLNDAESLKKQAETIQADYEKSLEQSRSQAVQAVQDVELAAKKKAADQIDAFRRKADAAMVAAEGQVLIAKDKAMGQMASVAAEVASVAAEKITGISTDVQNARAIVDSIATKAKAA